MPAGRPSKFVAQFHIPWAKCLARRGLTVTEIAAEMGIARSTFSKWLKEIPEFSEAVTENREIADSIIENSLYKRAKGYTLKEKRTIVSANPDGEQKPARIEVYEKEVGPDTAAAIFWLKNRNPRLWRDQMNVAIEATDDEVRDEIEEIVNQHKKKDVE